MDAGYLSGIRLTLHHSSFGSLWPFAPQDLSLVWRSIAETYWGIAMVTYLGPPDGSTGAPALPAALPPSRKKLEVTVVLVGPPTLQERGFRCGLDADIAGLDLESISYLAVLNEHWDLDKVDAIELEYRCWLQCVRDFPEETVVPSYDCDLYWHCHILFLGQYMEQTRQIFGYVLLHFPFSGLLGEADAALQEARFLKSRRIVGDLLDRVRRARSVNLQLESQS
jgi:hypothetical protein